MSTFEAVDDSATTACLTACERQDVEKLCLKFQTLSNSNCFNYRIQFIVTLSGITTRLVAGLAGLWRHLDAGCKRN